MEKNLLILKNGTKVPEGKFNDAINFIGTLIKKNFTGSIEINFSQGGITKIEKHEQIKEPFKL